MIFLELYYNKTTGAEIPCEEFDRLCAKYGEPEARRMVHARIVPGLEQEEKEAV